MHNNVYESEFEGVDKLQNQIIYIFDIGEGQEIIEQVDKKYFTIWKWR